MEKLISIFNKHNKCVFETGVWILYLSKEDVKIVKILNENVFSIENNFQIFGNQIMLSEIYYILCRTLGMKKSKGILHHIQRMISIIDSQSIFLLAGMLKCKFPISLADCYSISTGIIRDCPIVFKEEHELNHSVLKEIEEKFKAPIVVI